MRMKFLAVTVHLQMFTAIKVEVILFCLAKHETLGRTMRPISLLLKFLYLTQAEQLRYN